jgi:hypothetical protein
VGSAGGQHGRSPLRLCRSRGSLRRNRRLPKSPWGRGVRRGQGMPVSGSLRLSPSLQPNVEGATLRGLRGHVLDHDPWRRYLQQDGLASRAEEIVRTVALHDRTFPATRGNDDPPALLLGLRLRDGHQPMNGHACATDSRPLDCEMAALRRRGPGPGRPPVRPRPNQIRPPTARPVPHPIGYPAGRTAPLLDTAAGA